MENTDYTDTPKAESQGITQAEVVVDGSYEHDKKRCREGQTEARG